MAHRSYLDFGSVRLVPNYSPARVSFTGISSSEPSNGHFVINMSQPATRSSRRKGRNSEQSFPAFQPLSTMGGVWVGRAGDWCVYLAIFQQRVPCIHLCTLQIKKKKEKESFLQQNSLFSVFQPSESIMLQGVWERMRDACHKEIWGQQSDCSHRSHDYKFHCSAAQGPIQQEASIMRKRWCQGGVGGTWERCPPPFHRRLSPPPKSLAWSRVPDPLPARLMWSVRSRRHFHLCSPQCSHQGSSTRHAHIHLWRDSRCPGASAGHACRGRWCSSRCS